MITNERQYRITRAELRRFEEAIAEARITAPGPRVHPKVHAAARRGLESQAQDLRAQLKRYEALKAGKVRGRTLDSLRELPHVLIEARIAAGLTQSDLAERLQVSHQQIQRYEATRYSGVSVERATEVADALGLTLAKRITYPVRRARNAPETPGTPKKRDKRRRRRARPEGRTARSG